MKKRYYWQPELAIFLTYWSLTLLVFFFSMVISLENTRPNLPSVLVFLLFVLLAYLGWNRYFILEENSLKSVAFLGFKKQRISYQSIKKVEVQNHKLTLILEEPLQRSEYYLLKKEQRALLEELDKKKIEIINITAEKKDS